MPQRPLGPFLGGRGLLPASTPRTVRWGKAGGLTWEQGSRGSQVRMPSPL